MIKVLLVADEPWIANEVDAALADERYVVSQTDEPGQAAVLAADIDADIVLADMQVASRGGMAIARTIRDAVATDGLEPTPVILLLDRVADEFLARRSGADAWLVKPFNGFDLRAMVDRLTTVEAAEA